MSFRIRSIFGYIIGCISIIISVFILTIWGLEINRKYLKDVFVFVLAIISLLTSLLLIIFSVLMIIGINKKRHKLMLPYLLYSFVILIFEILYALSYFDGYFILPAVIALLIVSGLHLLLYWPIYVLYKDIRLMNIENQQNELHTIEKDFPHHTKLEV